MNDTNARVRYEKRGRVAYIILDRPHVLNAMDVRMHEELLQIWDDFEKDSALWVGVLTGAGDRSFSVGQDLKELVARTGAGIPPTTFGSRGGPGWPRLTERFNLSKPVVARVNGYAFGGGFELALACDIIVAAEQACFALPEAKLGLIPGAGGLFRLTRQIPFKIAMGYLMTGRRMTATRAYELGLVNEVVPISELDACVERWVEDILSCAPLSVRALKQIGLASAHLPLEEAFGAPYEAEERRRESEDCREGPLAFVQKRDPKWTAQ
ncbi:MAG TPA: enoyl-CoA-hydratase DpgD [Bryobacteraceae bacterium]|nr:enoyl-CoA-hydratase DpgD [Bryobacteraceae bacterium]